MKYDNGFYKWSFDPRNEELAIWPVKGSERSAMPQHYEVTGNEGYEYCSQGRLRVNGNEADAVIYRERPFNDNEGTRASAQNEMESAIDHDIVWIEE